VQAIPLHLRPLQGPPRPTEMPEDTTPNGAIVTDLLRTVQRHTSLIEQNKIDAWQIWNKLVHQSDLGGLPPQLLIEEERAHVLPVPDPLDIPSVSDLPAAEGDPQKEITKTIPS